MFGIQKIKTFLRFISSTVSISSSDTIFALSSGQGKCGVAVIRVSGSQSEGALKLMSNLIKTPPPRTALLRSIKNPWNNEILDKGLILWFPGPRSFTGEDSFELHVHGGMAVINSVLNVLGRIPKLRMAEPGEFTRRAFFNGKLDLTEVEGLADLLQAETEIQRKQAFLQSQGHLSKLYNKWKDTLTKNLAHIQAQIDFEETETLEENISVAVVKNIKELHKDIQLHLADGRKGEILRSGVKTMILGEPNVGKSSVMNLLCQRPAAIVTPIEGTTRDILQVTLNIGGYPLVLADTAGLRSDTKDIIEKEGINRALDMFEKSDLILLIIDVQKYEKWIAKNPNKQFRNYVKEYIHSLNLKGLLNNEDNGKLFAKECLIIINKTDLSTLSNLNIENDDVLKISCQTEEGIAECVKQIIGKLKILCGEPSEEHPSMNQLRHRQHLTDCIECLGLFLNENSAHGDMVIMAEYLRKSLRHLGKLVGSVTTEQLLDVIFRDFCIGK